MLLIIIHVIFFCFVMATFGIFACPREETRAFSVIVRSAFTLHSIHGWTESCSVQSPSQPGAVYPAAPAALKPSPQAKMGEWVKLGNQDTTLIYLSVFMDVYVYICSLRKMLHPDPPCLTSTAQMNTPQLCPLSPKRPPSSATHQSGAWNDSLMSGNVTVRSGSTLTEIIRFVTLNGTRIRPAVICASG